MSLAFRVSILVIFDVLSETRLCDGGAGGRGGGGGGTKKEGDDEGGACGGGGYGVAIAIDV